MTKKKKILTIVLSATAAAIVLTLLYDMIFPKLYVRVKYPDMTVTAIEKEKGSWSLFGISDPEMRYLYYRMYDPKNDISFTQQFSYSIFLPVYSAGADQYEETLRKHNISIMAEEGFREIADEFCSDYIFMDNPFNGEDHTGYLLFINERDPKLIKALADSLDGYVENFFRRKQYDYITYSIYICTDDKTYEKLKAVSTEGVFSAGYWGQAYFTDIIPQMLDCEATRITATNDGFSERIFTDMGDKTDDEYQSPESFDTVMFWYDSEPNAAYSGHFYLFGLDFNGGNN